MDNSATDIKTLQAKLKETDYGLRIVKQLLDVDDMIKAAEEEHENKRYLEAAKKFKDLNEVLSKNEELRKLAVYMSIMNYVVSLHEKFLHDSLLIWKSFIRWDEVTLKQNAKKLTLTVDNCDSKSDVIRILLYYDYLDYELKLLSKKLFHSLLEPIIKYNTKLSISSNDGVWTVLLEYRDDDHLLKSYEFDCCQIIDKLFDVFSSLFQSLDVFISDEDTFVNRLGELLETDFCETFVEHCLYQGVPTNKNKLMSFSNVIDKVESFDKFLKENGKLLEMFFATVRVRIKDKLEIYRNFSICRLYQVDEYVAARLCEEYR